MLMGTVVHVTPSPVVFTNRYPAGPVFVYVADQVNLCSQSLSFLYQLVLL